MDNFKEYLRNAQQGLKNIENFENVEIVLGNESCDMDSAVSSLLLGFLIYTQSMSTKQNSTLVLAVMNVDEELFALRTDNCYILKQSGTNLNQLVYRNQVDMESLVRNKNVRTHLVDHHILAKRDSVLKETVVEIFDHRPTDPSSSWPETVNRRIHEVGSCATLIADEILTKNSTILTKPLALLLYQVIVYDTVGLLSENGRAKELDIEIAEKLEEKYTFGIERRAIFDELWSAHNDVSHLTSKQLLSKDMKIVDGIPVPGLPMLVEDYLKGADVTEGIEELSKAYSSSLIVLIGLNATQGVKRDIAIYDNSEDNSGKSIRDIVIKNLMNSKEIRKIDFDLTERNIDCNHIRLFRQNNIKLTRKQIIPILKDSLIEYNSL